MKNLVELKTQEQRELNVLIKRLDTMKAVLELEKIICNDSPPNLTSIPGDKEAIFEEMHRSGFLFLIVQNLIKTQSDRSSNH